MNVADALVPQSFTDNQCIIKQVSGVIVGRKLQQFVIDPTFFSNRELALRSNRQYGTAA